MSVDVPGIQLGSIGTDPIAAGWRKAIDPAPVLYSYVMNNYWETNYKASQKNATVFHYSLRPHGKYDAAAAALRRLRTLTGDYEVPDEACNTWRALWHGLADLERAMHQHIHLENNILFPRALAS